MRQLAELTKYNKKKIVISQIIKMDMNKILKMNV